MPHMDEGRLQAWLDGERGGLTEEERAEVEAYLAENEDAAALVADLRAEDGAARDLLGALGAAEPDMPDFSEIVARSRTLEGTATPTSRPAPRRLPLSWAASVILAVGVGWMANEIVRREPRVVAPPVPAAEEPDGRFEGGSGENVRLADPVAPTMEGATASAEGATAPESNPPPAADAVPAPPGGVAVAENVVAAEPGVSEAEVATARRGAQSVSAELGRVDSIAGAPGARPAYLIGKVVDAGTGAAIPEAVITIPSSEVSALTGPDGRFRVELPPEGAVAAEDLALRVRMIGYGELTRPIPSGAGTLSIGDLLMETRAIQLEGAVVTGAALDGTRLDPVVSVDGVRIDPNAEWRRTSTEAAAEALEARPLRIEGLEWTEVAVISIGEASVVRVTHRVETGERVLLYQSRSSLEAEDDPALAQLSQRHESGLNLVAVAPFGLEGLEALLGEISPIG